MFIKGGVKGSIKGGFCTQKFDLGKKILYYNNKVICKKKISRGMFYIILAQKNYEDEKRHRKLGHKIG